MRIYPAILIRCATLLAICCAVPLQARDDSAAVMSGGYRNSLPQESFMLESSLQLHGAGVDSTSAAGAGASRWERIYE